MIAATLLLAGALAQSAASSQAEPAAPTPAHEATPAHETAPAREAAGGGHETPAEGAAEGHAGRAHGPAEILMHHVTDLQLGHLQLGPFDLGPTKHLIFFVVSALIVLGMTRGAIASYREGGLPRGLGALVETLVLFIRDEIAEKNIGHDGRKFTPLLCSFFFFILIAALLGLIPVPTYEGGHLGFAGTTATGNVSVTLGLATVSFLANQWAGISKHGFVRHYKAMVPSGLPAFLIPIMIPVELLGMFARPFALTVRLFANMIAGHMVVTTLLLLIPLMASVSTFLGVAMIPVSLALGLFIMFLEILVAFLQAFIFTLLSAIFIGMSAHPSH